MDAREIERLGVDDDARRRAATKAAVRRRARDASARTSDARARVVGDCARVDARRRETRARWCARTTSSMVVSTTRADAANALAARRGDEDAETFERRVRALYGGETRDAIPGQCVLDVDARNILTFEQGRWDLVRRDVVGVFGSRLGGAVAEFIDRAGAVSDAFGTRRNCVNLKKVLLHSQYEIEVLEMRLRRLMTFYRGDFGQASGYVDAARYREICTARGRCLGAAKAIFDGRVFTKQICCVPRHPNLSRPRRLASMPRSLVTHGYVGKAAADAARIGGAESSSDAVEESLKDLTVAPPAAMDARAMTPALTKDFEHIMTRVREELNLPAHYVRFIELSLIARGATKALWIRAELREFLRFANEIAQNSETLAARLRKDHATPDDILRDDFDTSGAKIPPSREALDKLQRACVVDRGANALEGAAPALRETTKWIQKILDEPTKVLFASGDSINTTSFVPDDFALAKIINQYTQTTQKFYAGMTAAVASSDLAGASDGRLLHVTGTHRCGTCERSFSNLWVTANTCMVCEETARNEGRCPVTSSCLREAWCRHSRRCLKCEREASCEICGISRGDAEDVVQLVETLDAYCVFLDFDRTICATKAGASPLPKNFRELDPAGLRRACELKSRDADLVGLLTSHDARAFVITRNSNVEAIEVYLKTHGVRAPNVRRVRRGESKGEAIAEALRELERREGAGGSERPSVFADDDVRELLRADVREIKGLHRVLFSLAS